MTFVYHLANVGFAEVEVGVVVCGLACDKRAVEQTMESRIQPAALREEASIIADNRSVPREAQAFVEQQRLRDVEQQP